MTQSTQLSNGPADLERRIEEHSRDHPRLMHSLDRQNLYVAGVVSAVFMGVFTALGGVGGYIISENLPVDRAKNAAVGAGIGLAAGTAMAIGVVAPYARRRER